MLKISSLLNRDFNSILAKILFDANIWMLLLKSIWILVITQRHTHTHTVFVFGTQCMWYINLISITLTPSKLDSCSFKWPRAGPKVCLSYMARFCKNCPPKPNTVGCGHIKSRKLVSAIIGTNYIWNWLAAGSLIAPMKFNIARDVKQEQPRGASCH